MHQQSAMTRDADDGARAVTVDMVELPPGKGSSGGPPLATKREAGCVCLGAIAGCGAGVYTGIATANAWVAGFVGCAVASVFLLPVIAATRQPRN